MRKIATLGPAGTFSDMATQRVLMSMPNSNIEICYYESIKSALNAIGNECDAGVLPIENFSEGFIPVILDELISSSLTIVAEIVLPIRFSLVTQSEHLDQVRRLYVQFVAKGQCSEFIHQLPNPQIVLTESNIESLERCIDPYDAAIVPHHVVNSHSFQTCIDNVNDYDGNQTRFLVFSRDKMAIPHVGVGQTKTSIIVLEGNDYPGLLGDVLAEFSRHSINLSSIISRPTRKEFGKYHFFIDFDGSIEDKSVAQAIDAINQFNPVKVLGSYRKSVIGADERSQKEGWVDQHVHDNTGSIAK
jgi:prephenate dehydratase